MMTSNLFMSSVAAFISLIMVKEYYGGPENPEGKDKEEKEEEEKEEEDTDSELKESVSFMKEKSTPFNLRLTLARSTKDSNSLLSELPLDLIQMIGEKISSVYIEEIPISSIIQPQYFPPGMPQELDDGNGNILKPTKCCMISSENEHLYRNESYFSSLSYSSDTPHTYFKCKDGICVPATWGSDVNEQYDKDHPSNIEKLLPTFHELEVMIDTFECKLWGTFTILDTRVSEYEPPITNVRFTGWEFEGGITQKIKLPPTWYKTLNKEKNRYYYWDIDKKKAQWNPPCDNFMDIMNRKIHRFQKSSENFTKTIHGNMDLKGDDFYDLIGVYFVTGIKWSSLVNKIDYHNPMRTT